MEETKEIKEKDWLTTFLLCLFLGNFGVHRFYTGKIASGVFQVLTGGGLGIWSLIDLILIAKERFKDSNGNEIKSHNKNLNVALIICAIIAAIEVLSTLNSLRAMDNLLERIDNIGSGFEKYSNEEFEMQVFIDYNATDKEIDELGKELKQIDGIDSIQFVSKEEALEKYIERFGKEGQRSLEKYREDNPLPDSYTINLKNPKQGNEIEQKINSLPNVKNVANGYNTIQEYKFINIIIGIYKGIAKIAIYLEIIKTTLVIIATVCVGKRRNDMVNE